MVYSKRAMAQDLVEVMQTLGFDHFGLAGHDRGGRVAYRLALDHSTRVQRLAVLDIVPTLDTAEHTNLNRALSGYHWFFLAQPPPLPEMLIGSAADFYIQHTIRSWAGDPEAIGPEAMAEYMRCFRNPAMIRATCEDYRAGLSVDMANDRADRELGKRITCPVLALWGAQRAKAYNPLSIWERWADQVEVLALDCGHFIMEEAPAATARALQQFFQD
jgi:haloacetate dehalogenase